MKIANYHKELSILIFCLGINFVSMSQIFNWYTDGFYYNQLTYTNIDGSGIDVEISGMETGSANPSGQYFDWLDVGINDGGSIGIQHTYVISFSETVDVEFYIRDINRDTIDYCYNDRLIIPGATILESYFVNIVNDTINAPWAGTAPDGWVRLKYTGINSLTIIHGEGAGCNPGFLYFSPLIINGNILDLNTHDLTKKKEVIRIYDLMGRECTDKLNTILIYEYTDGTTEKVFRGE